MPEDTSTAASAAKPKRRYTVSAKVLAANRRNLEKANAVPKEIRYRLTPKRVAACRQNRLKSKAARPPASGPVRRTIRRSRQKLAGLEDCLRKVNRVLNPDWRRSAIVAQAIGEMVWQCLTLLRNHCQEERRALIECWQEAWPRSRPPVAADLAGRLLTLFARREPLPRECKYVTDRLLHWGHFYFEMTRRPSSQPRQAMGRPTAPELGNPFNPFHPFHRPFHPDRQGTAPDEKPPDESTTEEGPSGSPLQGAASDEAEKPAEGSERAEEREAAPAGGEPQRLEFDDYQKQVEQAIGAPPALDLLVHEIVRLSWERHELIAQWAEQAEAQLEKLLRRTPRGWPADDFVAKLVEALGGQAMEQVCAEAAKLETKLKTAFYKYLRQRYGKHPVFRPFKPVSAARSRKAMKMVEALLRARRAAAERNVSVSAAGTSASQAPEPAIQPASSQREINSSSSVGSVRPGSQTTPDPQQFNHPVRGLEGEPGLEWHRRPAGTENEASETSAQQAERENRNRGGTEWHRRPAGTENEASETLAQQAERENRNRAGTEWHRRPSDMAAAVGASPAAGASGH